MSKHTHGNTRSIEHLSRFDAGLEALCASAKPGQCFTHLDIAQACGVSPQAIQQREYRALEKLKQQFGTELEEYRP